MTAQIHENLRYEGEDLSMAFCPELPEQEHPRIVFREEGDFDGIYDSTACWRRYQGSWAIVEDRFFLVRLEGAFELVGDDPLFAGWFSGVLRRKKQSGSPEFISHALPEDFFDGRRAETTIILYRLPLTSAISGPDADSAGAAACPPEASCPPEPAIAPWSPVRPPGGRSSVFFISSIAQNIIAAPNTIAASITATLDFTGRLLPGCSTPTRKGPPRRQWRRLHCLR